MAKQAASSLLYITDSTGYGGAERYLVDVMSHFRQTAQVKLLLLGEGNAELERQVKELDVEILRFYQPFSFCHLPLPSLLWWLIIS